jgi:hypothetical protein
LQAGAADLDRQSSCCSGSKTASCPFTLCPDIADLADIRVQHPIAICRDRMVTIRQSFT